MKNRPYLRRLCSYLAMGSMSVSAIPQPAHGKAPPVATLVWTTAECVRPVSAAPVNIAAIPLFLVPLIAPLAKAAINGLGDVMKKAGEGKDLHTFGSVDTSLYAMETTGQQKGELRFRHTCIGIVTGRLRDASQDPATWPVLDKAGIELSKQQTVLDGQDGGQVTLNAATNGELAKTFDAERRTVLILTMERSTDKSAFRFVPVYLEPGKTLAKGAPDKKRGLAVTISLLPPGSTADGAATAVRTIAISDTTKVSSPLPTAAANRLATSWIPLPAMAKDVADLAQAAHQRRSDAITAFRVMSTPGMKTSVIAKAQVDFGRLQSTEQADLAFLSDLAPYTIRADFHETQSGSKFLSTLGQLLADNADKASSALSDALDSKKTAASAEDALQKTEALRIAAITALQQYNEAGDASARNIAKIQLEAACRQIEAAGYAEQACWNAP